MLPGIAVAAAVGLAHYVQGRKTEKKEEQNREAVQRAKDASKTDVRSAVHDEL